MCHIIYVLSWKRYIVPLSVAKQNIYTYNSVPNLLAHPHTSTFDVELKSDNWFVACAAVLVLVMDGMPRTVKLHR